ncbi:class I adenylate-forming enzyme family protein [Propylenella binzhouense]|uniref:Cyclohexanecarboxylate-CoA ligase n=1 Tax=Propylenella binzhouense TaxID=2555902 RepID=A0A964T7L3_9HYPH|nr:class I adenylate-forming enzyme family protein [Propylenella binzhouense]MYZ49367.1 cyclohexanecarboxylate-CoA ligase [Propylenella binzhouense]
MFNTVLTLLSATQIREYYAAGFWRDDTIYGLVSGHARSNPDRPAMRDRLRRVTYSELVEAADRLATDLHAKGVQPGERVAVWLPSRIEAAVVMLACSRNGYVCCPSLHRDHTAGEIEELLVRMRASALVAEFGYGADSHRRSIFDRTGEIASLRCVYRLEPLSEADLPGGLFGGVQPPAGTAPAPLRFDPNTIVYLAFTSGTTGVPKGVMHSDNTLLANARVMSDDWDLKQSTVLYSLSPLSHNLGFGALVMTLSTGGEFVVHDLPRAASLVDRLLAVGATFIIGVPTHAIDLLSELRARKLKRLGAVKGFRISGAAVPPVVAAGLLEHGVIPQSGYGMTEAGSHHYTRPDDSPARMIETSGRACDGYEVKIWSTQDRNVELPVGEVGEIGGRGASLMLGYFDDQEATESSFNQHGWFMTGDLGRLDADGYVQITGRKKDVIIRGGHNIYPARIESPAMRHEAVDRAAVIPVPDERLGERACLAVVFRDGREVSPEALLVHLDEQGLSRFDMPEFFLRLDHLPLTPNGKVLKRELVEAVRRGELRPVPIRFHPGLKDELAAETMRRRAPDAAAGAVSRA